MHEKLKNRVNFLKPKVTILIPVYNGADYLEEAIYSALNQDYKNLEIIAINDGSTDLGKTESIIKRFTPDILSLKLEKNSGVSCALNAGINIATGEYISWLSADDTYEKNKISEQMKTMDDETISFTDYNLINYVSRKYSKVNVNENLKNITKIKNNPYSALLSGLVNGISLLIPKILLIENPFNEQLRTTQDYDCWFRIFENSKIKYLNIPLVNSRTHSKQGSHSDIFIKEGETFWINIYNKFKSTKIFENDNNEFVFLRYLSQSPYVNARREILNDLRPKVFDKVASPFSEVFISANSLGPIIRISHNKNKNTITLKSVISIIRIQSYLKKEHNLYLAREDLKKIRELYTRSNIPIFLISFNLLVGFKLRIRSFIWRKLYDLFPNDIDEASKTSKSLEGQTFTQDKLLIIRAILSSDFELFYTKNAPLTKKGYSKLDHVLFKLNLDLKENNSRVILLIDEHKKNSVSRGIE